MDVWVLEYGDFAPEQEGVREALCTTGNGYFATRGAAAETSADGVHYPGTYRAGLFNRLTSEVAGRQIENEDLVNLPNWLPVTFRIDDGPWFSLSDVEILDYSQRLDVRRGVLTRGVRYTDTDGRETTVTQQRFVHIGEAHLAGLRTTVTSHGWSGKLRVRSALDGQVLNAGVDRYRELANRHLQPVGASTSGPETIALEMRTSQSRVLVAEAARTRVHRNGVPVETDRQVIDEPGYIAHELTIDMGPEDIVAIDKVVSLYTSLDHAISEPALEAVELLGHADHFEELLRTHVLKWDRLWRRYVLSLDGNERAAQVLNIHIFHLLQTVSRHTADLDVGVPARGLHGEAYRGHIFWDELFVFPFLNLRAPELTRSLLQYRYRRLPQARRAAREADYEGAMYPWQSGSNGREESQTLHLNPRSGRWTPDASRLQRHINIAVAYNVWQYFALTADIEFMAVFGAEMILEIARFWASKATYDEATGRYEICGVMGPDEYHEGYPGAQEPGLDNNAYTNVMAVWVLCRALELLKLLPEDRRQELLEKLHLRREEFIRWDDISRKMRVVFHEDGIISQFEGYEQLEEFDWDGYREKYGDIQRLDRILEAEGDTPNRYKLSKQADVLMLFFLLTAEELTSLLARLDYAFDADRIPETIHYYLTRTAHGSTLSRVVHSWVLARSDRKQSWDLFLQALESDISDIQGGTTAEGIHLGAMAGTIDLAQRSFTGLDVREDVLWLDPQLPEELHRLEFDIRFRHHWRLNIRITPENVTVTARPSAAAPVKVGVDGQVATIGPGQSVEFLISDAA